MILIMKKTSSDVNSPAIVGLVHETPLQSRGETGTTTSTESRLLHLVQDPVVSLEQDLLGLVPVTALEGALKLVVVESVDVCENAILVLQVAEAGSDRRNDGVDGCCSSQGTDGRLSHEGPSRTRSGQQGCDAIQ